MKPAPYDQHRGLDLRIMRPDWRYNPTSRDRDSVLFKGWHCNDADWVGEFQGRIEDVTIDHPRRLANLDIGEFVRFNNLRVLSWVGWDNPYTVKALGDYEVIAKQEKGWMDIQRFNGRTRRFEKEGAVPGTAYLLRPLVEFDRATFERYAPQSDEARAMRVLLKTYATRRNRAPHSVIHNLAQQSPLSEADVRKIFGELNIRAVQAGKVQCTLS